MARPKSAGTVKAIVPSEMFSVPLDAVVPVGVVRTSVGTVPDAVLLELAGLIVGLWLPEFTSQKNPAARTAIKMMKIMATPILPIHSLYTAGRRDYRMPNYHLPGVMQ